MEMEGSWRRKNGKLANIRFLWHQVTSENLWLYLASIKLFLHQYAGKETYIIRRIMCHTSPLVQHDLVYKPLQRDSRQILPNANYLQVQDLVIYCPVNDHNVSEN